MEINTVESNCDLKDKKNANEFEVQNQNDNPSEFTDNPNVVVVKQRANIDDDNNSSHIGFLADIKHYSTLKSLVESECTVDSDGNIYAPTQSTELSLDYLFDSITSLKDSSNSNSKSLKIVLQKPSIEKSRLSYLTLLFTKDCLFNSEYCKNSLRYDAVNYVFKYRQEWQKIKLNLNSAKRQLVKEFNKENKTQFDTESLHYLDTFYYLSKKNELLPPSDESVMTTISVNKNNTVANSSDSNTSSSNSSDKKSPETDSGNENDKLLQNTNNNNNNTNENLEKLSEYVFGNEFIQSLIQTKIKIQTLYRYAEYSAVESSQLLLNKFIAEKSIDVYGLDFKVIDMRHVTYDFLFKKIIPFLQKPAKLGSVILVLYDESLKQYIDKIQNLQEICKNFSVRLDGVNVIPNNNNNTNNTNGRSGNGSMYFGFRKNNGYNKMRKNENGSKQQ